MNAGRIAAVGMIALSAGVLFGQWQVNPRVDNSLYGAANSGSVRYSGGSSSVAMRSEVRHAYYQSGALPSDIKMNQNAAGPMTQGGNMAYIPKPMHAPGTGYTPRPQGHSAYSTGSVSRPTMPSNANQNLMMPSGTMMNSSISQPRLR
jgi:hypothetical protein